MIQRESGSPSEGDDVLDSSGKKLGDVARIFVETGSAGEMRWVSVETGTGGSGHAVAPLEGAVEQPGVVKLPFDAATVLGAPDVGAGDDLGVEAVTELTRYYGIGQGPSPALGGSPGPGDPGSDFAPPGPGDPGSDYGPAGRGDSASGHRR